MKNRIIASLNNLGVEDVSLERLEQRIEYTAVTGMTPHYDTMCEEEGGCTGATGGDYHRGGNNCEEVAGTGMMDLLDVLRGQLPGTWRGCPGDGYFCEEASACESFTSCENDR